MGQKEISTSIYNTDYVHSSVVVTWVGIHILNCLNKFADLWKAQEALLMIASFLSYFH